MKTRRGRTLEAVLHPGRFEAFAGITDEASFGAAWGAKPMWVLANMAHAAYHDKEALHAWFTRFGARLTHYESRPDAHGITRGRRGYLAVWPDKAILAFRGTEIDKGLKFQVPATMLGWAKERLGWDVPEEITSLIAADILDDLNLARVPCGASEVHRGFHDATRELWPDIARDLGTLRLSDPGALYASGHSMGGAMAVIASMLHPFRQVVTFGEPRVGRELDKTLPDASAHIRYVNGDDPVTKIVPTLFPFNYEHHGMLREVVDREGGGPDWKFDHSIVNYAELLA